MTQSRFQEQVAQAAARTQPGVASPAPIPPHLDPEVVDVRMAQELLSGYEAKYELSNPMLIDEFKQFVEFCHINYLSTKDHPSTFAESELWKSIWFRAYRVSLWGPTKTDESNPQMKEIRLKELDLEHRHRFELYKFVQQTVCGVMLTAAAVVLCVTGLPTIGQTILGAGLCLLGYVGISQAAKKE